MIAENSRMYSEAASAGAVVAAQLARAGEDIEPLAQRLRTTGPRFAATCARGSSDHAATFAKYLIETRIGIPVTSAPPSISSVYHVTPKLRDALWIAISQSGKSPDLLAATREAVRAGARTLGLINAPDTPLADIVETMIPIGAGAELSVAATKSYIATLTALVNLVARWTGDRDLADRLLAMPEQLEAAWTLDWSPLTDGLADARGLYVIGRGPGLGIASEAALKFKETCGLHAEAFSAAEVRHGPLALVGPDFPLLVFRQSDQSAEGIDKLVADVRERGGRAYIVGATLPDTIGLPAIAGHPALEPILQIQSFYRAVNALAARRGFDPDNPRHLKKVTETI
jgi:glucosamine--fructose-6-phosphate aminotransferase (isomerizing)